MRTSARAQTLVRGFRLPVFLVLVIAALVVLTTAWSADRTRSTTVVLDVAIAVGIAFLVVDFLASVLARRNADGSVPFGVGIGIGAVAVLTGAVFSTLILGPGPSVGFTDVPTAGAGLAEWWSFLVPLLVATPPVTVPLVAVLGFLLGLASTTRERSIVVALVAVPWVLGVLEAGVFYVVLGAPQYVVGGAIAIPLFLYGESLARTSDLQFAAGE